MKLIEYKRPNRSTRVQFERFSLSLIYYFTHGKGLFPFLNLIPVFHFMKTQGALKAKPEKKMKANKLFLKKIVIVGSFAISIFAATKSEWLWTAFFMIDVIDRYNSLKAG